MTQFAETKLMSPRQAIRKLQEMSQWCKLGLMMSMLGLLAIYLISHSAYEASASHEHPSNDVTTYTQRQNEVLVTDGDGKTLMQIEMRSSSIEFQQGRRSQTHPSIHLWLEGFRHISPCALRITRVALVLGVLAASTESRFLTKLWMVALLASCVYLTHIMGHQTGLYFKTSYGHWPGVDSLTPADKRFLQGHCIATTLIWLVHGLHVFVAFQLATVLRETQQERQVYLNEDSKDEEAVRCIV